MKLKYRYVFSKDENFSNDIINFLDKNSIKYKVGYFITVEFCDSDPYFDKVQQLFNKYKFIVNEVSKVYSEKELYNAEWLRVRSVYRLGYPQPENGYASNITYTRNGNCNKCEYGLTQIDSFYINKIPDWKDNRNFYQLYWIEDEIFLSDFAVYVFKNNDIMVEYLPVKRYKNNEIIDGVRQVKIKTLDKGLFLSEEDTKGRINCSVCGSEFNILKGETILKI
ncbi:MAG: hypothetical protein K0Q49_399 [Haloplasmataceae bacterium]|jgi:hypothetical protein|nr:hypothetical protein [Haloplasmataceae bacterium]